MARPAPPIPGSSTHSSGGTQPPGTSATTHGDTPPAGHNTDTHTGEQDSNGTTVTANSSGTTSTSTKATGNDTHTASSNAQPSSTGTEIPHSATSPQEIDLARKITNNLDKVQAKRPLNPREQADYDKARNLLDRAAPNQPGTRNTGNPKDLVLAGDGPISQTHDAAADVPPPEPAQPANAVGTTIQGPVTTNPDAPNASANGGSGNSNAPFVLTQQQQIPAQGSGPTNAATNGNGQPPATVQDSPVASLPSPVPKLQGPQLPFAPSPNLEWHIPHDPSRHLLPDKPFDATRKPTGPPKVLDKNDTNIHNKRGVDGENETAEVLAQNGYDYEQVSQNKERISNATWAGKADGVFGKAPNSKSDVYSPSAQTNLRNIYETVVGKVDRQKSPYVIVRLEPGGQSIEDISKKFQENPIKDLKQLFVIKEGKLHIIY